MAQIHIHRTTRIQDNRYIDSLNSGRPAPNSLIFNPQIQSMGTKLKHTIPTSLCYVTNPENANTSTFCHEYPVNTQQITLNPLSPFFFPEDPFP